VTAAVYVASLAHRVRLALACRKVRCCPGCPGWVISRGVGLVIERCDDCAALMDRPITDDDAALLPEARSALASWDSET
jgi:hypothetical protein